MNLLQGYPVHIRNEDHRAELLRDCRYFHLRGLEQKLIAHEISYNPDRQTSEILLRLEDIKPSGISFFAESSTSSGWVHYSRPFVDDTAHELIIEVGSDPTILNLGTNQATFHGPTKARISALLHVITSKVDVPMSTTSPDAKVRYEINANTDLLLDGHIGDAAMEHTMQRADIAALPESKKRKLDEGVRPTLVEWKVWTGQWRVRLQREPGKVGGGGEIVLVAVKLDAFTGERARNARRKFLN